MICTIRPSPARSGKTWVVVLAALVVLAIGLAAGPAVQKMMFGDPRKDDSDKSQATPPDRVTALGRLQPAAGVIPIYGPPGDRIAKMHDKDGQPIGPGTVLKKNDPIATLASKEQREKDLKVAEIQLQESKAQLTAALTAGQKKIEAATAESNQLLGSKDEDLKALQAKVDYLDEAQKIGNGQIARLEKLKADKVPVAEEDLEKAKLAVAQAKAEHIAAVAAKKKAEKSFAEGEKIAKAKIDAARAEMEEAKAKAPIESAEARIAAAQAMLELTTLKAPVDGTVLKVGGREGQPTGLEPILQMAPLGDMVAIAEVYESDLERLNALLKKGPVVAEVSSPALPADQKGEHKLRGTVSSENDVTRMIAKNQVFALGPREDSDRRVVEVLVRLDPGAAQTASRFVGLQVTVVLNPGK